MNSTRQIYGTFPFEVFPKHIDWLVSKREEVENYIAMNMSIAMFSAMTIEGAFEFLLRSKIREHIGVGWEVISEDDINSRLISKLDNEIRRINGWDGYKRCFKTVFKAPLDSIITADNMEAISILFGLRGAVVAHGRSMNFIALDFEEFSQTGYEDYDWESDTHRRVEKYLRKKGFPTKSPGSDMPEPGNWFLNDITDHLYKNAINLLLELDLTDEITPLMMPCIHSEGGRTREIIESLLNGRTSPYDVN